jgi:hypothetical protein
MSKWEPTMNKQSRTADKGWYSGMEFRWGANSSSTILLVNVTQSIGEACEHGNEPSGSIRGGEFLD